MAVYTPQIQICHKTFDVYTSGGFMTWNIAQINLTLLILLFLTCSATVIL